MNEWIDELLNVLMLVGWANGQIFWLYRKKIRDKLDQKKKVYLHFGLVHSYIVDSCELLFRLVIGPLYANGPIFLFSFPCYNRCCLSEHYCMHTVQVTEKKNLVKNRKLKLVMIVIAPVVVVNQFSGFGIEKETEKVREREKTKSLIN